MSIARCFHALPRWRAGAFALCGSQSTSNRGTTISFRHASSQSCLIRSMYGAGLSASRARHVCSFGSEAFRGNDDMVGCPSLCFVRSDDISVARLSKPFRCLSATISREVEVALEKLILKAIQHDTDISRMRLSNCSSVGRFERTASSTIGLPGKGAKTKNRADECSKHSGDKFNTIATQ
jgi:hypothetical protein